MDEKPSVVPVGLGRRAVERGAKGSLLHRSLERASGAVGLRWQAVFDCQIVWNRSTRRAELPSQSPLYRFIRDLNRIDNMTSQPNRSKIQKEVW
jgi:hypothetical protein